jgi:hypothetical protein
LLALAASACGHGPHAAIEGALSVEDPARVDAELGAPPIDPTALTIVPTGLPPTAGPAIAPEPIMPKMDEGYEKRRMHPEAEPAAPLSD